MSDWIDKLKTRKDSERKEVAVRNAVRLHNADIIRGKAPAFLDALKQQIKADIQQLREDLPNDSEYHCSFIDHGPLGLSLSGGPVLPRAEIGITLNIAGQFFDIGRIVRRTQYDSTGKQRTQEQIIISVNDKDDLEFCYNGHVFVTTDQMSKILFSQVCPVLPDHVSDSAS